MKTDIQYLLPALGNKVIIIRNLEEFITAEDEKLSDHERLQHNKELVKTMCVAGLYDLAHFLSERLDGVYGAEHIIKELLVEWSNS